MDSFDELRRALEGITPDTPLPREGALADLYHALQDVGEFRACVSDGDLALIYLTFEEVIAESVLDNPGWHIENDERYTVITLLLPDNGSPTPIPLRFDRHDNTSASFLQHLKSRGRVTVYFLYILYGDLHRGPSPTLLVPTEILTAIP